MGHDLNYDPASPSGLRRNSGRVAGFISKTCMYYRVGGGRPKMAHRVIWEMFNGQIPNGLVVDHIDGDIYNNSIGNLRVVTPSINSRNRVNSGRNNTTGVQGISLFANNLGNEYYEVNIGGGAIARKRFSVTKLGKEAAFAEALSCKEYYTLGMKAAGYTGRHINGN